LTVQFYGKFIINEHRAEVNNMPANEVVEGSDLQPETTEEVNQPVGTTELLFGQQEEDTFNPTGTMDEEPQPVESGETATESDTQSPSYYTPEEMRNLSEGEIDTSRIPPEMQAFYRSMQANYTRKHMELAYLIKNVQSNQQKASAPRNLDEAFQQDPQNFMQSLDDKVMELTAKASELSENDPFEAVKVQAQVLKLQNIKNDYTRKIEQLRVQSFQAEQLRQQYLHTINSIPNFEQKQHDLTRFAVNELGYTNEELAMLSDPRYNGQLASKFVLSINRAYDKFHGAERKEVKKTPQPLLKTSGASPQPMQENANRRALFSEAQRTGDWTKVIQAMGY
jgi:hypothetical protein